MRSPAECRFSRHHVWALRGDFGEIRAGITHVPGAFLGDAVSVELPPPQTVVSAGEPIGLVESSSTVFELFSPVSGVVVELNDEAGSAPRKVTEDPYGGGWLLTIRPSDPAELDGLLGAEEYERFAGET